MQEHTPVLPLEVVNLLRPKKEVKILDATIGLGGHARLLLEKAGQKASLIGLDADLNNLQQAKQSLSGFTVQCVHANFSSLPECLPDQTLRFDFILADLGISSPHLDTPDRGFSFRFNAPLDMRLDQSAGQPASMLLSSLDRQSLLSIFRDFGEVHQAHKLADEVIRRRSASPVRTTFEFADAVRAAYGERVGGNILPQVFQALRIAVNKELNALETLLTVAPTLLEKDGVLAIISFHSLEDRMVKQAFKKLTIAEKDSLTGQDTMQPDFKLLTRKPILPSMEELERNSRSRSAVLRAIQRISSYTSLRS